MKFQFGQGDYMLQGLLQGPQLSFEDAAGFKFSNKRNEGVLLQLLEHTEVMSSELQQGSQSNFSDTIG